MHPAPLEVHPGPLSQPGRHITVPHALPVHWTSQAQALRQSTASQVESAQPIVQSPSQITPAQDSTPSQLISHVPSGGQVTRWQSRSSRHATVHRPVPHWTSGHPRKESHCTSQ